MSKGRDRVLLAAGRAGIYSTLGAAIHSRGPLTSNKYPFVEDTLGQKLQACKGLSVDCLTCKRKATLDVAELVKRLGPVTDACSGI